VTGAACSRTAACVTSQESLVATALLDCAGLGGLLNWALSATEMLGQLGDDIPVKVRASARWPKSPMAFTNELRRIAPLLRTRGISVKFTRTRDNRLINRGGGCNSRRLHFLIHKPFPDIDLRLR
jgi:hypothetical protein